MTIAYRTNRRTLLKAGALAGTALAAGTSGAIAQLAKSSRPTDGDIAILRFLSAVEQIESDLWLQYAELGGVRPESELGVPPTGNGPYTAALINLDGDMPQYIHDNTEDEFSHHAFLNAFLASIDPKLQVDLSGFATLTTGSTATGSSGKKRLTNLTQLTIDTSFWARYRSRDFNPDLDPNHTFPQLVPGLFSGPHTAIPRTKLDESPSSHIQAIANTAAFHFASIEQGGSSLYPTLALRVTNPVVLQIVLSIGPTETMHFQVWHDKAGNAFSSPANVTDGNLNFNFTPSGEDFQTNLIMPEPCPFLNRKFPVCSIIRPVSTDPSIFGAMAAVNGLNKSGLFMGHNNDGFLKKVHDLAEDADEARRQC